MTEPYADILAVGKTNSLGRSDEVVRAVLADPSTLDELYQCLYENDAWLRMRAIDSIEKVCRVHPEWLKPYIDRLFDEFGDHTQPSIQWHIAEIVTEVDLMPSQKVRAINWLVERLQDPAVDWIVAANCMNALVYFTNNDSFDKDELIPLLKKQQSHKSNSVVKRATKLLDALK